VVASKEDSISAGWKIPDSGYSATQPSHEKVKLPYNQIDRRVQAKLLCGFAVHGHKFIHGGIPAGRLGADGN
jgi:hypothetical protein